MFVKRKCKTHGTLAIADIMCVGPARHRANTAHVPYNNPRQKLGQA